MTHSEDKRLLRKDNFHCCMDHHRRCNPLYMAQFIIMLVFNTVIPARIKYDIEMTEECLCLFLSKRDSMYRYACTTYVKERIMPLSADSRFSSRCRFKMSQQLLAAILAAKQFVSNKKMAHYHPYTQIFQCHQPARCVPAPNESSSSKLSTTVGTKSSYPR
jgi:hypothetical protein